MKTNKSRTNKSQSSVSRSEKFIFNLIKTASVERSAILSGISESTIYRHRDADPEFAERWQAALLAFPNYLLSQSLCGKLGNTFEQRVQNCDLSYFVPYLGNKHLGEEIPKILKARFLAAFEDTRMLSRACEFTGIPRHQIWRWRRQDQEFVKSCEDIYHTIRHDLLDDLIDGGFNGVPRPIVYKGEVVGERRVRSIRNLVHGLKCLDNLGYASLPSPSADTIKKTDDTAKRKLLEYIERREKKIRLDVRQELIDQGFPNNDNDNEDEKKENKSEATNNE